MYEGAFAACDAFMRQLLCGNPTGYSPGSTDQADFVTVSIRCNVSISTDVIDAFLRWSKLSGK